jgi:small subunit ribosomal protein S16
MLMIRLRRMGAKHNPIYRLVVSDSRKRPTADFLDQVGTYNPNTEPPEIRVDFDKVEEWQGKGARLSETARSLLRRAQRQQ